MALISASRDATEYERAALESIRAIYNGSVSANVKGALAMAELLAAAQAALDDAAIIDPVIWGKTRQKKIDLLLNQYNTLGRIFVNLDGRRYGLRPTATGDFDIIAPATMNAAEYQTDIYPLAGPLLVLVVGAVIVAGVMLAIRTLDYNAQSQQAEFRKSILDADLAMAKQPAKVRAAYGDWKTKNIDLIKAANAAPQGAGILDRLLGGISGAGAGLGAILGVGIIAWVISKMPNRAEAQRETA